MLNYCPWPLLCVLLLSLWHSGAQGRPAAYGEDFVRLGASWGESSILGSPPGTIRPLANAAQVEQFRTQLQQLEMQHGPYANVLSEPLSTLAQHYQTQSNHEQALAFYNRALHVVRINEGLYSERQIPLLRGMLLSFRAAADWQALDDRYRYFFRLLGSGRPPFTEQRVGASLEFMRWQREAIRLGLGDERRRLLALIDLNDALLEAMRGDVEVPFNSRRDLVRSQLLNLYLLQARFELTGEPFMPPLSPDYIGAKPLSEDLQDKRLEQLLRQALRKGESLLQTLLSAAGAQGAAEQAAVQLAMADWYFWNDHRRRAAQAYAGVVATLVAAGETALLQAWLGQPVELPDNGVFRKPSVAGSNPSVVTARYDVSARGRLSKLELTAATPSEKGSLAAFRRRLATTLFRPRWSSGVAEAVSGISRDYQLLD